jgi:hypothetical protein
LVDSTKPGERKNSLTNVPQIVVNNIKQQANVLNMQINEREGYGDDKIEMI